MLGRGCSKSTHDLWGASRGECYFLRGLFSFEANFPHWMKKTLDQVVKTLLCGSKFTFWSKTVFTKNKRKSVADFEQQFSDFCQNFSELHSTCPEDILRKFIHKKKAKKCFCGFWAKFLGLIHGEHTSVLFLLFIFSLHLKR